MIAPASNDLALGGLGAGASKSGLAGLTRYEEAQARAASLGNESREALRARLEGGDVDAVAREFESLFASMLVKEMRNSLSEGLFGDGPGADTYAGWFDQHVGRQLADAGALDLAGMLRAGLPEEATAEAGPTYEDGDFVPLEDAAFAPLEAEGASFAPLTPDGPTFVSLDDASFLPLDRPVAAPSSTGAEVLR